MGRQIKPSNSPPAPLRGTAPLACRAVALGAGARAVQHLPEAGLSVSRPGSRAGTNTGLVHPSLANRSNVRGSARPSGNGDAAAMVRTGYRAHDAGNTGAVLDRHAGGQRVVGGTNNAARHAACYAKDSPTF